MQKEIYVFKGIPGENYNEFKERMFRLSGNILKEKNTESLKVCLTERKPPVLSVIPFRKEKAATLSVTGNDTSLCSFLENEEGFHGGYPVIEVLPVSYEKTWEDGQMTPGACLLTLFHKKPTIDRETFIDRWYNGHTPLSLRLHPLWNYSRNEVTGKLTAGSADYDGIVEEHVRTSSELLNPFVFFGPPVKVIGHMLQVLTDTRKFIHLKRIETYLAAEYIFKSQG